MCVCVCVCLCACVCVCVCLCVCVCVCVCLCVCVHACPNSILHCINCNTIMSLYVCRITLFRPASTVGGCPPSTALIFHGYFSLFTVCGYKLAITTTSHLHKLLASQLERGVVTGVKEPRPGARTHDLRSNVEFNHESHVHRSGHNSFSPITVGMTYDTMYC